MPTPFSRRNFLKNCGIATCGLAASAALPGSVLAALEQHARETRVLMNTFVTISLRGAAAAHGEALERAFAEITRLVAVFDRRKSDTPLSVLNAQGSLRDAPPEFFDLLARAQRCGALTGNAFDPTVAPLLDLFARYKNPRGIMNVPQEEQRAAHELVRPSGLHVGRESVRLERQGMRLTLDGIAKGYIADRASAVLLDMGVTDHLIDAGGDIVARGEKAPGLPWRVAVENPARRGSALTTLPLRGGALATSGSYQVFYDAARRHHHLINPALGQSPARTESVSVLAPTAVEADALATALSVMPPADALRLIENLPGRACLILDRDGRHTASRRWNG